MTCNQFVLALDINDLLVAQIASQNITKESFDGGSDFCCCCYFNLSFSLISEINQAALKIPGCDYNLSW